MSIADIDREIDELERAAKEIADAMELICKRVIAIVTQFAPTLVVTDLQEAVLGNPQRAKQLGVEGIRRAKDENAKLIAQLPARIEKALNSKPWPHREKPAYASQSLVVRETYIRPGESVPSLPVFASSSVSGELGAIGEFLDRQNLRRNSFIKIGDHFRYDKEIHWPPEVKTAMQEYMEKHLQLAELRAKVFAAEARRTALETQNLWDAAK